MARSNKGGKSRGSSSASRRNPLRRVTNQNSPNYTPF